MGGSVDLGVWGGVSERGVGGEETPRWRLGLVGVLGGGGAGCFVWGFDKVGGGGV